MIVKVFKPKGTLKPEDKYKTKIDLASEIITELIELEFNTVGISVGVTSADAAPTLLWTQILGMFLGRLEFFTVFVGVVRLLRDTRPIFN